MKILMTLAYVFYTFQCFALTPAEIEKLVKLLDERQKNSGDYSADVSIEQKEKKQPTKNFKARVNRRSQGGLWLILFTGPKTEAGKGYLRIEKNLFLYEPSLGKWERQTERSKIAGTGSRRDDLDDPRLSEDYTAEFIKDEKLQSFDVHHLKLKAKPGIEVSTDTMELWVDQKTQNILKKQEFALSGALLRTSYYPEWEKIFSEAKKADIYFPKKMIIKDELEEGNITTVIIEKVSLDVLPANIFTKAWIESQSR